jgi:hypothetical protein
MTPYRTNTYKPPLDSTNSQWCCICKEHVLNANTFKHPSDVGYVNVCSWCVDSFKHWLKKYYNWKIISIGVAFGRENEIVMNAVVE